MIAAKPDILYEDDAILVCRKPAGIATQTAKLGQQDMESIIKNYLKAPYIGVVHRLDQPVEGILVFAKTKEAAGKLSSQIMIRGEMRKLYYAVVLTDAALTEADIVNGENGDRERIHILKDLLLKKSKNNVSSVVNHDTKDAKEAELEYEIIKAEENAKDKGRISALVKIRIITGRHHQIRVQMSHAGMPLLGDMKYADEDAIRISRERNISNIALCAYSITFSHPFKRKKMIFEIQPENSAFLPFFQ